LVHQIRVIKEELGDNDDDEDDVATLEKKMQSVGMPATVLKHAQRELRYANFGNFCCFLPLNFIHYHPSSSCSSLYTRD
jgi:hypothetical protein